MSKAKPLLTVEWWPIGKPVPYARNARKISKRAVDKLAASIQEFGWRQPIVVDSKAVIVAGHTRLMAAQKLDMKKVPVHVASDLTEAQIKAYRLMDNRSHDESEWDMELVEPELLDLKALDFDLALTGFEQVQIQKLLAVEDPEEDNAPPPPVVPVTVTGDLWLLGGHRVLCGDSTSIDAVERLMDDKKADMVFTDPPYGIGTSIANDDLSESDLLKFNRDWAAILPAFTATNCHVVCFHSTRLFWTALDAIREAGFAFTRYLTLYKPNDCTFPWQGWILKSEAVLLFSKGKPGFLKVEPYLHDTMVHNHGAELKDADVGGHPCCKPMAFVNQLLARFVGDLVLDLFGGSGSTLIACEKTGRNARLMELDPKYVDVIVTRWQQFTGLDAVLDDDGRTFDAIKASRIGKNKAA